MVGPGKTHKRGRRLPDMWAIGQKHVRHILASSRPFYQLLEIMHSRELRNSQMINIPGNYYSRSRVRNLDSFTTLTQIVQ